MAKVKFVKAVKYEGVRFAAHTPFTVKDEELEGMKAAGAIVMEGPAVHVAPENEIPENTVDMSQLTKMTVNELRQFAEENSIAIPVNGIKADIFNAIVSALG